MTISSTPGGAILTGDDAVAFMKQIDEPAPAEALAAIERGREMARAFFQHGKVIEKLPNRAEQRA